MSPQALETVLSRMMTDGKFAESLFSNAEAALAGFELTADEKENLKNMTRTDFEQYAKGSPEERKSMSTMWNHNEAAH